MGKSFESRVVSSYCFVCVADDYRLVEFEFEWEGMDMLK